MNSVCLVWDWKGALTYQIMLLKAHFPYLGGYWFCVIFLVLLFFRLDVVLWEKKLLFWVMFSLLHPPTSLLLSLYQCVELSRFLQLWNCLFHLGQKYPRHSRIWISSLGNKSMSSDLQYVGVSWSFSGDWAFFVYLFVFCFVCLWGGVFLLVFVCGFGFFFTKLFSLGLWSAWVCFSLMGSLRSHRVLLWGCSGFRRESAAWGVANEEVNLSKRDFSRCF